MPVNQVKRGLPRAVPALTAIVASLCLSACVVAPLPGPPAAAAYPGESVVVAPVAPPPLYAETITVAPAPGYIWIGGYWGWGGGRYAWNAGHWEPPHPGYYWAPRTWVRGPGGWHQRGGHWAR